MSTALKLMRLIVMHLYFSAFAILFVLSVNSAHAGLQSTSEDPTRLVAIGDIHGDGLALKQILLSMQLIDENENWTGKDTMLVLMGDILDRGQYSRQAIDLIIKLENEAKNTGGRVVTLMGNHEFMVATGDLRYFHKKDAMNYADFRNSQTDEEREIVLNAFSARTRYGQWLQSLPAMIKVGDKLFVHAGVESWIKDHSVHEINMLLRKWIHHCYYNSAAPPASSEWIVGETGPLWTRRAAYGEVKKKKFAEWLAAANLAHVIVGHTITENQRPVLKHEKYGDELIMIDSAISSAYSHGSLSAIEWTKADGFKSHVFKRPAQPDGKSRKELRFHPKDGIDGEGDNYKDCILKLKKAA